MGPIFPIEASIVAEISGRTVGPGSDRASWTDTLYPGPTLSILDRPSETRLEAVGFVNCPEVFQSQLGPGPLGGRLVIIVAKVLGARSLEDHRPDAFPPVM